MNLPENGSVVIVDDQPNQALPIITALSKHGIASTWYRGNNRDEIPDKPLQKVRLVFMDLQLVEGDNDSHTIASRVIHILEHLVASDNGPFMLAIWSLKNSLYGDELTIRLKQQENHLRPICTITLNKKDCIRQVQDSGASELIEEVQLQLKKSGFEEDDLASIATAIENNWIVEKDAEFEVIPGAISLIESAIAEQLKSAGIFHLFIIWENLIKNSAAKTVANISTAFTYDDNWEQNMRDVFRRMGKARVGQNEVSDEKLLKESILTFIQSFTDNVETELHNVKLPDYTSQPAEQLLKLEFKDSTLRLAQNDELVCIYRDIIEKENGSKKTETLFQGKNVHKLNDSVSKSKIQKNREAGEYILNIYWSVSPRLNTGLHLEIYPTNILMPGNIYEVAVAEKDRLNYALTYFVKISSEELKTIRFIELEVSPICDYAQKKWKRSRLISGVIYPKFLTKEIRMQNDHLYTAHPIFFLENDDVKMVFDYHLFKSRDKKEMDDRVNLKYRLRREILLDIIANVSAHVNRPGISFVE